MSFPDHFSHLSQAYRDNRPRYPLELFTWLAAESPSRYLAWDCGTGNGQAAVALATLFDRVIATDASAEQVHNATPAANIDYRLSLAEMSPLPDASADLITVAQALHWFNLDHFFIEVDRVLKPDGLLAVIGYRGHRVTPTVDAVLDRFEAAIGPFWPPERALLECGFETVTFPFDAVTAPAFRMTVEWDCETHLGYLRTWSANRGFIAAKGFDPVSHFESEFNAAWGDPATIRTVTWDLIFIVRQKRY